MRSPKFFGETANPTAAMWRDIVGVAAAAVILAAMAWGVFAFHH